MVASVAREKKTPAAGASEDVLLPCIRRRRRRRRRSSGGRPVNRQAQHGCVRVRATVYVPGYGGRRTRSVDRGAAVGCVASRSPSSPPTQRLAERIVSLAPPLSLRIRSRYLTSDRSAVRSAWGGVAGDGGSTHHAHTHVRRHYSRPPPPYGQHSGVGTADRGGSIVSRVAHPGRSATAATTNARSLARSLFSHVAAVPPADPPCVLPPPRYRATIP